MIDYLSLIDTHTSGPRCDVTPLFANAEAFQQLVLDLLKPFPHDSLDGIAGIDALGFILGAAMAITSQKGFIPIRKGGKLPVATLQRSFIDYTRQQKTLELRHDASVPGMRLLVVDEWIETGAQMQAALALLEQQGAVIVGIATINIDENEQTAALRSRYHVHSLRHEH